MCEIVMERCEGGTLYDALADIQALSEAQVATVFRDIVTAVQFLHDGNSRRKLLRRGKTCIVHRDLKPQNILLRTKEGLLSGAADVVIIDFGTARIDGQPDPFAVDVSLQTAYSCWYSCTLS